MSEESMSEMQDIIESGTEQQKSIAQLRVAVKTEFEQAGFYPKVSIVIPVYNGANYMKQAIDSALAQTYGNIEVIVVNDGSQDDGATDKIARSYGNQIRYFKKPNGGVATALNYGIEKMTGEYFSWLSHDDMYTPYKIEREVRCLREQGDPSTIIAEGFQVIDAAGKYLYRTNISDLYTEAQLKNPVFLLLHGGIHGCGLLIYKNHFQRVGLFDPSLPTTQDYDLWFRMFRGQKICYMKEVNVLPRSHDEQGSKKQLSVHLDECNRLWIGMMDALSKKEKEDMSGSEYEFYHELWDFLRTKTIYKGATQYAQHMKNRVAAKSQGLDDAGAENTRAYIERMCYEFSKLLNDVTEENNRAYLALEKKCAKLEEKCWEYERKLLQSRKGIFGIFLRLCLWMSKILSHIVANIKDVLKRALRYVFKKGKGFAIRLGVKDSLKKTKLFRRLYQKGIIDKLRR